MDSRLGWHEHNLSELGELSGRDTMANWRMRHGIETPERFQRWLLDRETERIEREVAAMREAREVQLRERRAAPHREAPEPEPELRGGFDWPRFWHIMVLAILSWVGTLAIGAGIYHALRLIVRLALHLPHA